MNAVSTYFPNFHKLLTFHHPEKIVEKIKNVASSALVELSAALTFNLTIRTTLGIFLLPSSAHFMTAVCGIAAIAVGAILVIKACRNCFANQKNSQNTWINFSVQMEGGGRSLARLSIINTATIKLSHYIHELGHAGAALLCYIKADPTIMVKWYEGTTEYNISYGLTKFGEFLGEHTAMLFVTSAGFFFPVFFAIGEFTMAHFIHKKCPLASEVLKYHGISQILNLAIYGWQAFGASKTRLQHDFIRLWVMGGIHPLIPLGLIIILPICAWIGFKYAELGSDQQIIQT